MDKIDYIVLQIVENTIPIGINLQSQCNGKGVYIDSFYRNNNGELLPAELCESLSIGDKLMFINEKAVQDYDLKTVIKLISTSIRPLKLEFKALTLAQPVKDVVHQRGNDKGNHIYSVCHQPL